MTISLSVRKFLNRPFLLVLADLGALSYIVILFYIMVIWHDNAYYSQFYSNPFFDRTSTHDHLLDFLGYLGLFVASLIVLKKPLIAVVIPSFVFGIGNMFADTILLTYYYQVFTFDYVTPILMSIVLVYFYGKTVLKYLVGFIVSIFPTYLIWHLFGIHWDFGGSHVPLTWVYVETNYPYFWNGLVNEWIVFVWTTNFIIGFILITMSLRGLDLITRRPILLLLKSAGDNMFNISKFKSKRFGAKKGVDMLEKVILLAVTIFVVAFIVPPALTALATSALTSVNTAVQTLFQLLLAVIAVVAIILLIYYETVRTGHS